MKEHLDQRKAKRKGEDGDFPGNQEVHFQHFVIFILF